MERSEARDDWGATPRRHNRRSRRAGRSTFPAVRVLPRGVHRWTASGFAIQARSDRLPSILPTMKLSVSSPRAYARTEEAREKLRYPGVPVVFVLLGQGLIQVVGPWLGYTAASLLAAAVITVPKFFANKHFVWRVTSREDLRNQVLVFSVALMLGVSVATLFTYLVENALADQTTPVRGAAVFAAQLLGLGIAWAGRLIILDRWLVKPAGGTPYFKFNHAAQPNMAELGSIWGEIPHDVPRPRVSVIIPALNEELNLPYVAARMPSDIDEIVVVNGASVDDTARVARQLWPDGVHIGQTRRGKGNALACGIAAASGDIIVLIDSDGSTDPAEIPRFVAALIAGADYAKGSRFVQGGGSDDITRFRHFGNKCLNGTVNLLFATRFTDLCYGYNAFWRRCLDTMRLPDIDAPVQQWGDGFEIEALINVRVASSHLKIAEVCSYEKPRMYGSSNLRAISDGMRVLRTICKESLRPRAQKEAANAPSPSPLAVGEAAA
jgi:putative flippase GtrA